MGNDKFLLTIFIGAVSTIPAEILSRLLLYFGIGKYSIYQLTSLLVTFNRPNVIIGLIVNVLASGTIAYLFYLALEKLRPSYLVIKAILISVFAWLVCELIFTVTVEGKYIEIRPIGDYYNNLFCALIFGITFGLLLKKFLIKKSISA